MINYNILSKKELDETISKLESFLNQYNIPFFNNYKIKYIDYSKLISGKADINNNSINIYINLKLYNSLSITEKFEYKKMIFNIILHEAVHLSLYKYNNNLSEFLPVEIQQKYGIDLDYNIIYNFSKDFIDRNRISVFSKYINYSNNKILKSFEDEYNSNINIMRKNILKNYGKRDIDYSQFVSETLYGANFLKNIDSRDKIQYNRMLEDISRAGIGFIFNISKIIDNKYEYSFKKNILNKIFKDVTNYHIDNSIYISRLIDDFIINSNIDKELIDLKIIL